MAKTGEKLDELWPRVDEAKQLGLEARRPFEQRWMISLAFLTGRQFVFFNATAHMLQQIKMAKGRVRNVDNQLLPRWKRQVADLIKNDPVMSVVPATNDEEDIKAARLGDKVLKAVQRNLQMKKKLRKLAGWIYALGNGFLDDKWDHKAGPVEVTKEGKLVYTGNVDVDVWSPFDILVPWMGFGDAEVDDFPWIIKMKRRGLDWIKANYPERGKLVLPEAMSETSLLAENILEVHHGTKDRVPEARVLEYKEMPSAEFPNGLFLVAANGIVLDKQDYPFTSYHLEQFKDIEVPGMFWGKATLEEAIGLQRVWNRTLSGIDEYNRRMGKGQWLVPFGANFQQEPSDQHGYVNTYKPIMGHAPKHVDLKGLPSTYPLILESTRSSLQDLFWQHEVTRGTNKSDLRSGEMVALLLEQDAHGAIPTHAIFEESLERVMSRVLARIGKGYDKTRTLQVVGKDSEWEFVAFKGADLRNNYDVSVKKQSSLPDSRMAREAAILDRFEKGLYGNPQDAEVRRHVMNMLDDAVVKDIYGDERLDEAWARRENELMHEGPIQLMVNAYDDHQIHLREHTHHRKQMEYQRVKIENEAAFAAMEASFTFHIQQHEVLFAQAQQAMLKQQLALEGKLGQGDR